MNEVILTVAELAEREGVDYLTASGLLRYLREKGIASETAPKLKEGKGRKASQYKLPQRVELTFTGKAVSETPAVVETPTVSETPVVAPVAQETPVETPAPVEEVNTEAA